MKINFILPSLGESGGLKVIYRYAEEFIKLGHQVEFYFPIKPYSYKLEKYKNKFIYIIVALKMYLSRYYNYKIIKKFNYRGNVKLKPVLKISNKYIDNADVVIASAWPTAYDVEKLDEKKGKKFYFVQGYEVWDDEKKGKQSYFLNLQKIVIAEWIKKKLEDIGVKDKIYVVNNGLDIEYYKNDNKIYSNNEKVGCLMLSHHLETKGVLYGLQAFELAKSICPNIKLTMFGLEKLNSIPKYVEFIENPSMDEIKKLYCNNDIYIFPSIEEGWGLTVVEAMAAKCAVVGSNVGCLLELGINDNNALISEPKDFKTMSENIIKLVNDVNLRKKISENAFNSIQNLKWDESVSKFLKIIEGDS